MTRLLLVLLLLTAAPAFAQDEEEEPPPPQPKKTVEERLSELEAELANLRSRLQTQERDDLDDELREKTLVQLYGDIGFRYHMLFESQTETFNRPEFRLHLGVFGTAYEVDDQRIRYDMRLTTSGVDENGKPVPTLAWLPFPGFGALPRLSVDRFLIDYTLADTFFVTMGRFPTPYSGTEMLFDRDYAFQGLSERVRFDRLLPDAVRRRIPRLELVGVQGYLAQNQVGLPTPPSSSQPIYIGGQFRIDFAPFEQPELTDEGLIAPEINSEVEFRAVAGIHWYDGEEAISQNLGVGYLGATTNILGSDGRVQSGFLVGEVYAEVLLLRTRRARVKAWFHGLYNFRAEAETKGQGEFNETAFDAGISWGMERFTKRWDFRFAFHYFIIEADALIPEFNSELMNTNIKGYEIQLAVRIFPTITAFGYFSVTEREDFDKNGFGRPSKTEPGHSGGQSIRFRIGLFLEF